MSASDVYYSLPLESLARRCAEESRHFFHRRAHDPRYCFELFRRAIVEHSDHAWTFLCNNYRPLVTGWVKRHRAFLESGEEVSYFVNGSYAKMWSALSPEKFASFGDLKSLLRYLQLCVSSVITDYVRGAEYHARLNDESSPDAEEVSGIEVEEQALEQAERAAFWQAINVRLNDEKERVVLHYSYVIGFKPREIYEAQPDLFADVQEIYRIKENILSRLRRDEALQQLLLHYA